MTQPPRYKRFIPFAAVLGFLILGGAATGTAHGQWTSIGPDGGWVEILVIDPLTPSTLYAGTERGLVYKSTDSGAGWRLMNNGFPTDLNVQIRGMVIDPVSPQTLYMATSWGVVKSTDGARSWMQANEGINANGVTGLAIDPSNPSTLYVGSGFPNGVFRSTDAANSWTMVLDGAALGKLAALVVAPSNPSIVYLGASSMVHKSTDGGDTWNPFSTGLDDAFGFNQIVVHPTAAVLAYAASDNGLFKTTNGGNNWAMLNTPETIVRSVVLDPSDSATVYAVSDLL